MHMCNRATPRIRLLLPRQGLPAEIRRKKFRGRRLRNGGQRLLVRNRSTVCLCWRGWPILSVARFIVSRHFFFSLQLTNRPLSNVIKSKQSENKCADNENLSFSSSFFLSVGRMRVMQLIKCNVDRALYLYRVSSTPLSPRPHSSPSYATCIHICMHLENNTKVRETNVRYLYRAISVE